MNPENARRVLRESTDILDQLGIRWWLGAGTALGLHRNGLSDEFLLHDTDIDICTLDESAFHRFTFAALDAGWDPYLFYSVKDRWVQCCVKKDAILVDLYLFHIDGDQCRCDTCNGTMRYPARMILEPEMFHLKGKDYPIPHPIEEYLEVRFGPNWRTPVEKKIPWYKEAANLELQGNTQITWNATLHRRS